MALKVIDSHFHVWNLDTQDLPWLEGTDGTITHTYTLKDLEAEYARQAGVEFVGGVYVEVDCADHEAEDKIAYDIKSADASLHASQRCFALDACPGLCRGHSRAASYRLGA